MDSNDIIKILDRHKKNITCDLCRKRFWPWQKAIRSVIRTKDNVWSEYYHLRCLEKSGILRRIRQVKSGRWDNKDDQPSSNVVH